MAIIPRRWRALPLRIWRLYQAYHGAGFGRWPSLRMAFSTVLL